MFRLSGTFAVTLGPFFFSSADEPFGKARKIRDPTMTVTATKNFILLSQRPTINKKKKSCPRTAWKSLQVYIWPGGKEGVRGYPGWGLQPPESARRILAGLEAGLRGWWGTDKDAIGLRGKVLQPIRCRRVTWFSDGRFNNNSQTKWIKWKKGTVQIWR